jgi:hypothetical protein
MRLLLMLFITFSLTSCSTYRYIYTASPANNPVFTQKGESKISGYYSTSSGDNSNNSYAHGFDMQGAYAVANNWAITASYLNRKEKDIYGEAYNIFDNSLVNYKRNLFEFGGGYFIPANKAKTITVNMYGGYGTGKFSFTDDGLTSDSATYSRYHQSNISKWYIQPAINFLPGTYFRIAFAMKFSFVKYHNIETNYSPDELEYFSLQNLGKRSHNFTEPSLSFQLGIPKIPWVKIDAVFSGVNNRRILNIGGDIRTFNFSIGLNMNLSGIHQKKK